MRASFFSALFEVAKKDKQVVLVTADMGFNMLEKFRDQLPGQFINSGISEANSMSMAAGMALMGKKVFVYSITPFVTYRCYEQVRLDICYHNANVKIIGCGSGLDYGPSGTSHQPTEDIGVMRMLPSMSVVCPADPLESAALPELLKSINTPVFVRLGRGNEPKIHKTAPKMEIGKGKSILRNPGKGKKLAIFATGNIVYNVHVAAQRLAEKGVNLELFSMPWIKPLDEKLVLDEAKNGCAIITVEEHSQIGGLRSAVCGLLSINGINAIHKFIALPDAFQNNVGDQNYLRKLNGLDPESIEKRIFEWSKTL